jgi:hypothetical protein
MTDRAARVPTVTEGKSGVKRKKFRGEMTTYSVQHVRSADEESMKD